MKHTVRICMAAYNTADFIAEAFASIVRQKDACELFFVCVDDGSDREQSDRIRELFLGAGFRKGHAVLKRLDENSGLTAAWREASKYFKECEYTTWLDSDDYYCRDDVFVDVAEIIDRGSPDVIAFRTTDDESPVDTVEKLAFRDLVWMCCKCVRTEFTPSFDGNYRILNDVTPHMDICDAVNTVSYVGRKHFYYRDSPISLCQGRLYGRMDSIREIFNTLRGSVKKYNRRFVTAALFAKIKFMYNEFADKGRNLACSCERGEKDLRAVVPYPSVDMMPPEAVLCAMRRFRDRCVFNGSALDGFLVPCGSGRAFDGISSLLAGGGAGVKADAFRVDWRAENGTSAVFSLLFGAINKRLPQTVALLPPWWEPTANVDLTPFANELCDDVLSIELAGWPWSECGGYMNYVKHPSPVAGYSVVQSVHMRDRLVFNPSVPQVLNASEFVSSYSGYFSSETNFLYRLNDSTYYGRDNVSMVLVPDDTKPMFMDALGTDPAYRPEPMAKKGE